MTTITFVSRYIKTELNIKITTEKANRMFHNKNSHPFELYLDDCDRVNRGYEPVYLSKAQVKKLQNYLPGTDVWASVSITKHGNLNTSEIVEELRGNGGFNNFHHWNKAEVAEWIMSNYQCSKCVANNVAYHIA